MEIVERVMDDNQEWISTGKAAQMLGYRSVSGFRTKFLGVITAIRQPGGQLRWSKAEIVKLRGEMIVTKA